MLSREYTELKKELGLGAPGVRVAHPTRQEPTMKAKHPGTPAKAHASSSLPEGGAGVPLSFPAELRQSARSERTGPFLHDRRRP